MSTQDEEARLVAKTYELMRARLRLNAWKMHWRTGTQTPEAKRERMLELADMAQQQLEDLKKSIVILHGHPTAPAFDKGITAVRTEAADVMNLVAMIVDLAGDDAPDSFREDS